MSKKVRKKNEVETETYDILQLDEKIKKFISSETKKIEAYRERVNELTTLIDNVTYREKKKLQEEKKELENKIEDIKYNNTFAEYICLSQDIINEYMKVLEVPVNISFFGKKNIKPDSSKKEVLLERFLDIAKKYIPIKTYKKEVVKKQICDCGNTTDFNYTDNTITCDVCSIVQTIGSDQTNFKDIDRVNFSQKYKYNRKIYFRDTVNRYEGKQNKKISQEVEDDLECWFEKHNLININEDNYHKRHKKISKEHLHMALSETGHNLHYEDINLLHNRFTGIPCPDISHVRNELFEDFEKVIEVYEKIDTGRLNSLNGQYILYQLLRGRKVKVNINDFGMLKTRDKLLEYDEIYEKICVKLEKSFNPTV